MHKIESIQFCNKTIDTNSQSRETQITTVATDLDLNHVIQLKSSFEGCKFLWKIKTRLQHEFKKYL